MKLPTNRDEDGAFLAGWIAGSLITGGLTIVLIALLRVHGY